MALAVLLAGAAQSHALVESHVIANAGCFTNHHAQAVIDEQAPPDLGAGMDFNSGKKTRDLREQSRQQEKAMSPKPVIDAIKPDRMQAGVAQENFEARAGRGIVLQHVGHVFAN